MFSNMVELSYMKFAVYIRGGQLVAYGPNVAHLARHNDFSSLQKHSWKIFKSEISSNLPQ